VMTYLLFLQAFTGNETGISYLTIQIRDASCHQQ